jgi:hypothetical protein
MASSRQGIRLLVHGLVPVALSLAWILGCANFVAGVKRSLREPGEHFQTFPEEVWKEYGCGERALPFLEIEKSELLPRRMKAGEEFNHRLVYALCPRHPTAVVSGTLHTRILHRNTPVVRETDEHYDLKPGRWAVDAFVKVPEDAETGIYSIEIEFVSAALRFEETFTFAVERRETGSAEGGAPLR